MGKKIFASLLILCVVFFVYKKSIQSGDGERTISNKRSQVQEIGTLEGANGNKSTLANKVNTQSVKAPNNAIVGIKSENSAEFLEREDQDNKRTIHESLNCRTQLDNDNCKVVSLDDIYANTYKKYLNEDWRYEKVLWSIYPTKYRQSTVNIARSASWDSDSLNYLKEHFDEFNFSSAEQYFYYLVFSLQNNNSDVVNNMMRSSIHLYSEEDSMQIQQLAEQYVQGSTSTRRDIAVQIFGDR